MAVGGFAGFPWLLAAQTIISLSELQETIDQLRVWILDESGGGRRSVPHVSHASHGRVADRALGNQLRKWNGLIQGSG